MVLSPQQQEMIYRYLASNNQILDSPVFRNALLGNQTALQELLSLAQSSIERGEGLNVSPEQEKSLSQKLSKLGLTQQKLLKDNIGIDARPGWWDTIKEQGAQLGQAALGAAAVGALPYAAKAVAPYLQKGVNSLVGNIFPNVAQQANGEQGATGETNASQFPFNLTPEKALLLAALAKKQFGSKTGENNLVDSIYEGLAGTPDSIKQVQTLSPEQIEYQNQLRNFSLENMQDALANMKRMRDTPYFERLAQFYSPVINATGKGLAGAAGGALGGGIPGAIGGGLAGLLSPLYQSQIRQ